MGQKSCVDRLFPELREKLLELLNNPAVTQAQIVDAINAEAGEPLISKSSLNRYAQRMKKFAEKNRQAREVADAYLEKYGSDTRNKLGKVVNEQIRLVAFDLIIETYKASGAAVKIGVESTGNTRFFKNQVEKAGAEVTVINTLKFKVINESTRVSA